MVLLYAILTICVILLAVLFGEYIIDPIFYTLLNLIGRILPNWSDKTFFIIIHLILLSIVFIGPFIFIRFHS